LTIFCSYCWHELPFNCSRSLYFCDLVLFHFLIMLCILARTWCHEWFLISLPVVKSGGSRVKWLWWLWGYWLHFTLIMSTYWLHCRRLVQVVFIFWPSSHWFTSYLEAWRITDPLWWIIKSICDWFEDGGLLILLHVLDQ
jgi:hypothetical protein